MTTDSLISFAFYTILLIALCGGAVSVWTLLEEWWRTRDHLPSPDDPRLRNEQGVREWRAKRAIAKRRWTV